MELLCFQVLHVYVRWCSTQPHVSTFLKVTNTNTRDDGSEAEGVIKDYFGRQVWVGGAASVE